ncbi:MAG: GAF domain-containing protein, partial [Chloroflexota bacterium]|nr:GAF domain-containing protein [Chloroflexota bacterium]
MDALNVWPRLWPFVGRVGIRAKIVGIAVGSVLLLGLAVAIQTRLTLQATLDDQLRQQAVAIGRDLAARSADPLLTGQPVALHQILNETTRSYTHVRYAFILDPAGRVVDHTFGPGFPAGLDGANAASPTDRAHLQLLTTEEGRVWDVAVPILDGQAGTARVGLSAKPNQAIVDNATSQILTATGVVALLAIAGAFLLALPISRAVQSLLDATQAIARGDFGHLAQSWAPDEVGQLSQAFNAMSSSLASSRSELLQRNRELEALNATAASLADVREPDEMLAQGLAQALDAGEFDVGGIMLLGDDQTLTYRVWRGLSAGFVQDVAGLRIGEGIAGSVAGTGEPIVIDDLAADPRITRAAVRSEGVRAFASVPLRGRAGIVGVLNAGRRDAWQVSAEDLRLLRALGSEIGVGLENARLWAELRRREAVRTELLARAIAAQEEERKRVARELHDETSQALTSLLIGLDQIEDGADGNPAAPEQIGRLRGIVSTVLEEVHDLSLELRPSALDDAGLVPGISRYLKEYERRHGLATDCRVVGVDGLRLLPAAETAVFRIIQEALTNVARHGRASGVSVLL